MPQRDTLSLLVFNSIALIYIFSDALALFFIFIRPADAAMRFFAVLKETGLLFFLIAVPFFLDKVLELTAKIKKINWIVFWTGLVSAVIIGSCIIFSPDIIKTAADYKTNSNYLSFFHQLNTGLPIMIRNIILTIYLMYTISLILFLKIRKKYLYPVNNVLIGLSILFYIVMAYFYSVLFTDTQIGFGGIQYPPFTIGIVLLILFINFGSIDISIIYSNQLINIQNDIDHKIYFDALLDIPNRMGFMIDLQSELDNIGADGHNFSLIFLDIDDFKNLNECFGEQTGNEILRMLSKRLKEYFSNEGTLYRIGGDEFVLLLKNNKTEEEVKNLAGKIIGSLRNSFTISEVPYTVTASLGILEIPKDGRDTEAIINNAYNVIRSAKKTKNTFTVFNHELTDNSSNKINIVNLLRRSIDRDQFTLFYQPIVDRNKNIIHLESLLRCTNPDPSIGGPGVFIPIIEEAGLINDVDNMVIRKAFHDMEMRIGKRFSISINLSVNQLTNPAYSNFLSSFVKQHGIEPQQIIFEITESKLIENMSAGRENLLKLKNRGFSIAIDDFGKGFSSLTYLAELPVDILKMDMVFVHSVPGDSRKEAMARYILEMAHSLKLKVVAEGFELQEQFDFFKQHGCDLFQGYYFARPMPLDKLLAQYPD
ncbi:MAG: EAL domain-containing protein [Spirochaetes bacterium]|nr:EAL domain-containing protein [Spirochaetota bacterium]